MKQSGIEKLRRGFRYLILSLVLGVLIYFVFSNIEKAVYWDVARVPAPAIVSSLNQKLVSRGANFELKDNNFNFIEKPVVYIGEKKNILNLSFVEKIATSLGFTQRTTLETSPDILTWVRDRETLRINLKSRFLEYFFDFDQKKLSEGEVSKAEMVKESFQGFYNKLSLNKAFIKFSSPEVKYGAAITSYTADKESGSVDPSKANIIGLTYPYLLDNLPLVNRYATVLKAQANFGRNNTLISAQIPLILNNWMEYQNYPKLSPGSFVHELESRKGTLVAYERVLRKSLPSSEVIVDADISKVSRVYLLGDEDYNYIVPSYIVEANCLSDQGSKVKATFYLPAIKSIFYK